MRTFMTKAASNAEAATALKPAARTATAPELGGMDMTWHGPGHDFSVVPASATTGELTVNAFNDEYEQEADRIAGEVTDGERPARVRGLAGAESDRRVQTKRVGAEVGEKTSAPHDAVAVLRGAGSPLDARTRSHMESRFGQDFGHVRVHTDATAASAARSLDAVAYTSGSNIVFDAGQYAPSTVEGRRLIAHELTHVIQQRGAAPGRMIQRQTPPRVRAPRAPSVNTQLATLQAGQQQLARRQDVLAKQQAATALDLSWRAQFGERLASYRQAIYRISGGLDAAGQGFQAAQVAQAQTDALRTQLIGAAASIGLAIGFEWAFSRALGLLRVNAQRITDTVEAVENPFNAAVSSAVNVQGVRRATQSAREGQMPSLGGGAMNFLTRSSEMLEGHVQRIEQAFATRSQLMQGYSDEQWLRFDPQAQEAIYRGLLNNLNAAAAGVESLKDAGPLALVLERHLWALWIKGSREQELSAAYAADDLATASGSGSLGFGPAAQREPQYDVGADIEDRLNAVGVARAAGVRLSGHWYRSNSSGWRLQLYTWAFNYRESIRR